MPRRTSQPSTLPTWMEFCRATCVESSSSRDSRLSRGCVSAWKKDPLGGVIGVQKGPLW